MTNGKAMIAVLAGVVAGAALGVLFTSDKGSDMRKNISKKGQDFADALNDKIEAKFDELLSAITGKVRKPVSQNDSLTKRNELVS